MYKVIFSPVDQMICGAHTTLFTISLVSPEHQLSCGVDLWGICDTGRPFLEPDDVYTRRPVHEDSWLVPVTSPHVVGCDVRNTDQAHTSSQEIGGHVDQ